MNAVPPRLSLIAAMARNRVIGAGGKIPWHLPGELALFKRITLGHTIIMGRTTWESIGRLLPGRSTVIVSRQPGYAVPGARVAHSLEEAVAGTHGDDEVFVIGGAQLYAAALPQADRIYLTRVDAAPEGDTFMPAFESAQWREDAALREAHPADERNPYAYVLTVYDRTRDRLR